MITAGKHTARATGEFDLGTADTGTEQVALEFEILEGPDAGQCISYYGYFTEKTEERTVEALRNAGWQGDDISTLEGLGSRRVTLVVEHEPDKEGVQRAKVRWVNRVGSAGVKLKSPMDDAARRRFAARVRGLAGSRPALPPEDVVLQRPPTNGTSRAPVPPVDDDPLLHGDEDDLLPF